MFGISVTDLDSYAYYLSSDYMSLDDWRRRLLRLEPRTPAMDRGIRFHKMMETGAPSKEFEWMVDVDLPRPDVVELPVRWEIEVDGFEVALRGRVDAVRGRCAIDYKTQSRAPDWAEMLDRWQWRAYLAALPKCERFVYECFQVSEQDGICLVQSHRSLEMKRYAGLEDDVAGFVSQYLSALRDLEANGLIELGPGGVVR